MRFLLRVAHTQHTHTPHTHANQEGCVCEKTEPPRVCVCVHIHAARFRATHTAKIYSGC